MIDLVWMPVLMNEIPVLMSTFGSLSHCPPHSDAFFASFEVFWMKVELQTSSSNTWLFSWCRKLLLLLLFFFCLFAFSRAAPVAYGDSQARGLIGGCRKLPKHINELPLLCSVLLLCQACAYLSALGQGSETQSPAPWLVPRLRSVCDFKVPIVSNICQSHLRF